jgi:hypothetical protein
MGRYCCRVRGFDFRRYAPVILIVVLVVTPLAIWAATSGGSKDNSGKTFYVERSVGFTGEPELLITIDDPAVEVEGDRTSVEVECTDATGKVIVKGTQPWPFPPEQGYAPHAHQPADADKVEQARRCRVIGTNKKLEADVQ